MFNWKAKNWKDEDFKYEAKREVNNKQSEYIHHNSGYLFSPKLKRFVGYESLWGECLFYYCLELDKLTIKYYEQPVEVPMFAFCEKTKEIRSWNHIPDVLVFREGYRPHLFQIKGTKDGDELNAINRECQKYSVERGWVYSKIYPKELPEVFKSNVLLLWNYMKARKNVAPYITEILYKMNYFSEITMIDLAKSFSAKIDYRFVLPIIYHMICIGELTVDFAQPIDQYSLVRVGSISKQISTTFINLEELYENSTFKN